MNKILNKLFDKNILNYTFLSILGISLSLIILMPSLFDINNYKYFLIYFH